MCHGAWGMDAWVCGIGLRVLGDYKGQQWGVVKGLVIMGIVA